MGRDHGHEGGSGEKKTHQGVLQTLILCDHQTRTLRVRTLSWPGMVPRPQK